MGSVAGALILYTFGHLFSQERIEAIVARWGKYVGISLSDLTKTFNWFERYGSFLVFFGRLFPVIRSLVSIPAGLIQMSITKFVLLTAAGSAIWNSIWISLGVFLGERWESASAWAKIIDYVVYAAIAVIMGWFVLKLWQYRKSRS
jgi:membrane protein DedA with SNARE-associated domain